MNVHILADSTPQSKQKLPRENVPAPERAPLPLQYFKGVGPAKARLLAKIGILEIADLLYAFPRGWEDRRIRFSIGEAPLGEKAALRATVRRVQFSESRNQLGIATALLEDRFGGSIQAVWFKRCNPRYDVFATLRRQLESGNRLFVYGLIEDGPSGRQVRVEDAAGLNPDGSWQNAEDALHFERIVPLYTTTEGLSERLLRTLIGRALTLPQAQVPEVIPRALLKNAGLQSKRWALQAIHFPSTLLEKEKAREILALEEFLVLETALGLLRRTLKKEPKHHAYELKRTLLTPFRERLGFEFTAAQKRVIREIFDDLLRRQPMNRLLQGDVGSGKTLVALSAMLLAIENGGQAALMAPTEILAEQHALTLRRFLQGLPVRTATLTGRQTSAQKRALAKQIAAGEVDLVIGTHALIQDNVRFSHLMLAVVDEQHRFGVEHRSLLRSKGRLPDVLVMTATPIPRTLALTLYGDLDVSAIDELPPGRHPVETRHVEEAEAYREVRAAIRRGHQAYIVFPLVEESDKVALKAAVQEAESLQKNFFNDVRVGVLHGQMPSRDKEAVMDRFRRHAIDLLISTSIIEVGIDVPNATLMVIQHAERFGLSTLHQLRGRIGRGDSPSSCLLIADIKSDGARRRIQVMTETTDGFKISEEDLSLRGPGEVLGVLQHGLPEFRIGHLVQDARLIQSARHAAEEILAKDPGLRALDHQELKKEVFGRYAKRWPLGAVG